MKQPLLVLIIFFLFIDVFGQDSFSLIYGGDISKRPNCIKQIDDCYYLLSCDFELPSFRGNTGEIVKIDKHGRIINKVEFITEGQVSGPLREIHPLNSSELLVFGGYRQDENSNTSIWVIKMDTALNVIWEVLFPTNVQYLEKIRYTINDSDNLAFAVTLTTGTSSVVKTILFLELTLDGNLVRSRYETTGSQIKTNGFSIISINNGYYTFVEGFASYMPAPLTSFAQRLDLDSNFIINRVHTLPDGINKYMTAININEHSYYLTGSIYYTGFYHEIAIQKTDTSNTVLVSNHSGMPGDIPDDPAWHKCMVVKDENTIYTGGIGYAPGGFTSCNLTHPKVFILTNYDSLLNNRWTKFYGSDTACYYMMVLDATDDGGCIMAGTILSPISNPNQTDVIIIKVDSEGLITSSNRPDTRVMQALVYPNPGNDYLMLQTGQQNIGAIFTLYNLSGQKLTEQTVNSTTQQVPTSELPSGTYVWTLSKGNTVIETGKWIKY